MRFGDGILWRRAQDWLAHYRPQLIAVTGSTGKTIAIQAIAIALGATRRVRTATESHTSPAGVARAILGIETTVGLRHWISLLARSLATEIAEDEPDTLIIEVGATAPGDVDRVAHRITPNVVVVTNVDTSHTRLLGDKTMVAHELEALTVSAPADSAVILNADDPLVLAMGARTRAAMLTVGHSEDADIHIVRTHRLPAGGLIIEVNVHGQRQEVALPAVIARHHLVPILMGVAVAHALGEDPRQALERLRAFPVVPHCMQLREGINRSRVIDDTDDATPESMAAGLQTLAELTAERRVAILGDLTDLGGESFTVHREVGVQAAAKATVVILVGQAMDAAGAAALRAGADVHRFDDSSEVGMWLTGFIKADDLIYVSGSRDMRMERVVERLLPSAG